VSLGPSSGNIKNESLLPGVNPIEKLRTSLIDEKIIDIVQEVRESTVYGKIDPEPM
jgi:hypothetical protein